MTGRRSWAAAVVQWRNWPVLVKIGAVLVVPVVAAIVLGALRVQADIALSESYSDVEQLAALRGELVPAMSLIQRERVVAVQQPAAAPQTFQQQAQSTDIAVASLDKLVRETPNLGSAADAGYEAMKRALGSFQQLRARVLAGEDSTVILAGYNTITGAILDFDRSLVGRFPDQELTGTSMALYDLQVAREQVSQQQALVLIGVRRGELSTVEREWVIEADVRLADMISDLHAVAPPEVWQNYLINVTGKDVSTRQDLVRLARAEPQPAAPQKGRPRPSMPFGAQEWNNTSDTTTGLMTQVARTAATQLRTASAALQDQTSSRAGSQSVLLLAIVLLAAAIGGVVGRYLLKSLGTLRKTALDVAAHRLPAAVADIRAGNPASIEPVPVVTTEEFGQLARAFDTVHSQAVRSAEEEATLRGNLRNILVNLSRRSQSLVERQLKLMEQLEQKENDPDQLANLFKLDHLATRMRRNNENLVVLSGAELGRRFTDAVPVANILRAAVSEVEHYERAVVRSSPRVYILGYAAGDLVRSVAELVENATAFSPPDTQVVIQAVRTDSGAVLVEIIDEGIGMGDTELADANTKVALGGGVDVPVSRQMGLFVVGSLAARQGFQVALAHRPGDEEGLIATILVPTDLITESPDATPKQRPSAAAALLGSPTSSWLGTSEAADPGPDARRQTAAAFAAPAPSEEVAPNWPGAGDDVDQSGLVRAFITQSGVGHIPPVGAIGGVNGTEVPGSGVGQIPVVPTEPGTVRIQPVEPPEKSAAAASGAGAIPPVPTDEKAQRADASGAGTIPPLRAGEQEQRAAASGQEPRHMAAPDGEDRVAGSGVGSVPPVPTDEQAQPGDERPANVPDVRTGSGVSPVKPEQSGVGLIPPAKLGSVGSSAVAGAGGDGAFSGLGLSRPEVSGNGVHAADGVVRASGTLSGQLESVGIHVRLPELPVASSPASILFRDGDAGSGAQPDDSGFAWLGTSVPSGPPAQRVAAAPVVRQEPGGALPKRVPQAQLHAGARRTSKTVQPPRRPANAERARGFLSSFQAGVRLSKAAEQGGDVGEEKP
ncbi:nitrate- and nitrite sensing domain-containing protein [Actinocrispum sp. NPDC049592]|uniref:nitrate- and nitrite sensing domain-containing protein n=1 Tax=Actinocrispum sp. NPDC049592 TaxID=3154835 RepID=UPI00342F45F0